METRFQYGGYTFVADGKFKDHGFNKSKNSFQKICRALHYPNSGKVADGEEKFNYVDFYEASGNSKADVFLCEETGERYVPCTHVLAVFDKTSDSDAVCGRFNRRKEEREKQKRKQQTAANLQTIKDWLHTTHDGNCIAQEIDIHLIIFERYVEVETIWYNKDEDKTYVHCGCEEFEGDLAIKSLSDQNIERIVEKLSSSKSSQL